MAGQFKSVGRLLGLAFVLPANLVVGYIIGYLLDRFFSTHFLHIVFLLLGIAAGFVSLIREIQKGSRDDQG